MCGKFTQMASWGEVVEWSDLLKPPPALPASSSSRAQDAAETITPMRRANVLHLDAEGNRAMTRMRWGWSKPQPQAKYERPDHIHARAELIDTRPTFRDAFARRRGILVVRDFNEGKPISASKTEQHTIVPRDQKPLSIAVIWERETRAEGELHAFVMVTVPANRLIGTITDRMPAVIRPEDWPVWLGEEQASAEELKALLLPFEGDWSMAPEVKTAKPKAPRPKADLFEG